MKNITLLIFLYLFGNSCFSQGGWDIGYIAIDSINQDVIGKDIKLDFRNETDTIKTIPKFLMNLVGLEDSTIISLDGEEIELKEKRNIHGDWGFYDEQFLECSNYNKSEILRIYHSVIEKQNDDSILVRLYIEVFYKYRKGRVSFSPDRRYCKSVWLLREILNGVMIAK